MNDVFVRQANDGDVSKVTEIEKVCFPDPWSEEAFYAQLNASGGFFVLCDGEQVVGYAVMGIASPEAELYNIAVMQEYRGKGLSDVLFKHALEAAVEKGVDTVFLEVRESNLRARRFYERLGFEDIGRRKRYYSQPTEDAILMRMLLKSEK